MPKVRLSKIAKDNDFEFDLAFKIAKENLKEDMLTGKGAATWVNEEGQALLDSLLLAPELYPKEYKGMVVRLAPNKSYVYVKIRELKKVVACVVPRMSQDSFIGKNIYVEEIKDKNGSTFRYVRKKLHK
jgi:hypothetical protein|tara:strand:+ start:171 stop:557 length:387 start_codon:yes stop_codon:yes gene_type:complete